MNHQNRPMEAWIQSWLIKEGIPTSKIKIERLAGDGSNRTFYRLTVSGANASKNPLTFIALSDPGWHLSKDYAPHQAYLAARGLPVPKFLFEDAPAGFLMMEDLGDELLQLRMNSEPQNKMKWLHAASGLLAQLHGETFPVPDNLPIATRRFDGEKYFQEMCFTFEHLVVGYFGYPTADAASLALVRQYCDDLALLQPIVFAHRDYHTRNLLVQNEKLILIDFQDARLGPPHYDLVSLIYDAYVPIQEAERAQLMQTYRTRLKPYPLFQKIAWDSFSDDLELVAFQRVVKAAGSFASFFTRYGKSSHLAYLRPALETALKLQKSCAELPKELNQIFNIEEWLKRLTAKGL